MTTMADVASAAGVSVMTVSYSFNQPARVSDTTRTHVLDVAERLGYTGPHRGAASLRSGRTGSIGVVLTEQLSYAFEDPSARRFLTGIADACVEKNTAMVLLPNSRIGVDLDRIGSAQVDGFVVWTTTADDPALDVLADTGKPVCVQGGPRRDGMSFVGIDDGAAARAVGRVVARGAQSLSILSFPLDESRRSEVRCGTDPAAAAFPVTRARLTGYRDGFTGRPEAGRLDRPATWSDVPIAFAERNVRSEGYRLGAVLLDSGVDAIAAMSDELALGVLDVARDLGVVVPQQLSVCGWDDVAEAASAGLTTVVQSLYDQGHDAARLVLGEIDSVGPAQWHIEERASTRRVGSIGHER